MDTDKAMAMANKHTSLEKTIARKYVIGHEYLTDVNNI
jgi:hypothetical protein